MSATGASTNATAAKERLYSQLASSLARTTRNVQRTADLCELLQMDLHALRIFAALDAAKFMAVAKVVEERADEEDRVLEEQAQQSG
ncbi:uncharacterized protein SCHCODRAFT_02571784 [Schizophyllum commune H4-8]|nr:uncharacterized protein SCHCODRAFT_02571784 [Schizophyllum commune H4-8]KAI5894896.1 hypothetical protein SCHCODRAFT_02571784 [Schizophyllum commune H4-8]